MQCIFCLPESSGQSSVPPLCIPIALRSYLKIPFIILCGNYLLMGLFSSLDQAPLGKNLYCVPFVFLAWIGFEHSKGSINICWMNQTQDSMSPGKPWISVQQPSGRIPCLSASHYVDSIHSWGSSHGSLICFTHFLSDYGSYPNPSPLGWSLDPMPDLCSPLLSRSDPESCSSSHHCLDPTWTDRSQAPWCGTVHDTAQLPALRGSSVFFFMLD